MKTQLSIAELIGEAQGVDLVRARLSSPVSRLIRMNLGDVFRIFVVHDWRHVGQMRRLVERHDFPPA